MDANFDENARNQDALVSPHLHLIVRAQKLPLPSYMKFYHKNAVTGNNWILFGATEINETDPNLTLANKLSIQYFFPLYQLIRVEIYQVIIESSMFYAHAEFNLADLLRNPDQLMDLSLTYEKSNLNDVDTGTRLSVGANDPSQSKDFLTMQYAAEFNKVSLLGRKSYFILWRLNENNELEKVAQSIVLKGRNPVWPRVCMKVSEQFKREGIFRLVVHNKDHKVIGHVEFTYGDIMEQGKREFRMFKFESPKKGSPAKIKEKGRIILKNASLEKSGNFTDYLAAGLDMQCYFGLDYSEYFDFYFDKLTTDIRKKDFKDILGNIAKIIYPYLGEKMFSVYGVGASVGASNIDFFPIFSQLNGLYSPNQLVEGYEKSFGLLQNKKDLKLSPLVKEVIKNAKEDLGKCHKIKYYVSVFLITGKIHDWDEFISEVVLASYELPMSFLFMGIGDGDFSQLEMLNNRWSQIQDSQGRKPFRKNVMIVLLKDHIACSHASIRLVSEIPRDIWNFSELFKLGPSDFRKTSMEVLNLFHEGGELNSVDVDEVKANYIFLI